MAPPNECEAFDIFVPWDVQELDSVLSMMKGLRKRTILGASWLSVVGAGIVPRGSLETSTTVLVILLAAAKAGASRPGFQPKVGCSVREPSAFSS